MKSLKNDTNELIYKTNGLIGLENKFMVTEGKVSGRGRLGAWDRHVHTAIFKTDNQQGPNYIRENSV